MEKNIYISKSSDFQKNRITDKIKIYDSSEVKDSDLGEFVTVGNDAIILKSKLSGNNSINRRNYIFRSKLGFYTYTGIGTMIRSSTVGRFCSISWNVSIGGGDHPHDTVTTSTLNRFHFLDTGKFNEAANKQLKKTFENQPECLIGNDVLISSNVVVLRGTTVGNGAIIGAGAVVTKDVEPYSIVAGVPAKKIKMRFDDETIAALQEIQWWNWPREVIRENLDLIYSTKVDESVIDQLKEIAKNI